MKIIVAVDDHNGMLFNHRRQSRDRKLCDYIASLAAKKVLRMNEYSYELFSEYVDQITASEDFLDIAESNDYCFVENIDLTPYEKKITEVCLCHWNRTYPADLYFSLDISDWKLSDVTNLQGYSHDKITISHYVRRQKETCIRKTDANKGEKSI